MKEKNAFAKWLELQYINWMKDRGEVISQGEFASYLELDPMNLSNYINSKRKMPDPDSIEKIAAKLGPEIYDVLGLARPDPQLKQLTAVWHLLSQDQIRRILAIALEDHRTTAVPTDD
jgi:transcriptional regulator with XRE-family HTH domain